MRGTPLDRGIDPVLVRGGVDRVAQQVLAHRLETAALKLNAQRDHVGVAEVAPCGADLGPVEWCPYDIVGERIVSDVLVDHSAVCDREEQVLGGRIDPAALVADQRGPKTLVRSLSSHRGKRGSLLSHVCSRSCVRSGFTRTSISG
jgi:hypothetical protein